MQNRLYDAIVAIRQWPDHHRKIFAVSTSVFLTLIIAVGWAATLPGQFAALAAPAVPGASQTAAATLSVVTPPAAFGPSATESLEGTLQGSLNTGGQILNSIKTSFTSIFSNSGATPNSASAHQVVITDQNNIAATSSSNPYNNLKYYVSHGVLITDPSPAKK